MSDLTRAVVASPSRQGTSVSVSTTVIFNNTPVIINSQDIANLKGQGLVFSLTNPVPMGSFDDLIDWLNTHLGLPITADDINNDIQQLPSPFKEPLLSLVQAIVTLTILNINTKTNMYEVAASIAPQPPLNILDVLEVQSIGIQVSSGESGSPSSP